jgi:hypothetical protein
MHKRFHIYGHLRGTRVVFINGYDDAEHAERDAALYGTVGAWRKVSVVDTLTSTTVKTVTPEAVTA